MQNLQLYFLLGTVTVDVEEDEVAGVTIEDEVVLVAIEDEVAGGAIEDEVVLGAIEDEVLGAIVDGGAGGGGIAEDETFADGAVCLAERGGLGRWDGYDVSVSIVASSRFGNNGSMGLGGWSWVGNNDCEWGKCWLG